MKTSIQECFTRIKTLWPRNSVVSKSLPWRGSRRLYSHSSQISNDHRKEDIAVVGGGITGLVTAFYLAKGLPSTTVTIFNATQELGGWLQSKSVDVGTGNVVFEQGPRTLRPAPISGWVTLDLIRDLGIEDQVISTSKNSVAAQNRYVYYNNHLVRMPGPGVSLLQNISAFATESIFRGIIRGAIRDLTTVPRPENLQDETVAGFITRRFDGRIADNILSAIVHGIYAGDIDRLSMKTLFPRLWDYERMQSPRALGFAPGAAWPLFFGRYAGTTQIAQGDLPLFNELDARIKQSEILHSTASSSVYTFKRGIGTLAEGLETRLREMSNVRIKKKHHLNTVQIEKKTNKLKANTKNRSQPIEYFDCCVYACRHPALRYGWTDYPFTRSAYASTVMVINLYFTDPNLLPVHGFGYLIPRSLRLSQNPERALGVVFDSDATVGQDTILGTKLTVMLGGHWWDSLEKYPDEDEGASMAKAVLARHLKVTQEPRAIHVSLQKDCIPQYLLGHDEVMEKGDAWLKEKYGGRVRVGGSPYTGVGLNDCVKAGRDLASGIIDGSGETGLEMFRGGRKWQYVKYSKISQQWEDVDALK